MSRLKGTIQAALATLVLTAAAPSAQAAYFNLTDWYGALGTLPPVDFDPLPVTIEQFSDTYGTWDRASAATPVYVGPNANPFNPSGLATRQTAQLPPAPTEGVLSGLFSCHPSYEGCLGVKAITYKLPFQIIGLFGDLDYRFMDSQLYQVPFFGFRLKDFQGGSPYRYDGFWGDIFAPTDTITIFRTVDTDNIVRFDLRNAQVIPYAPTPVPEPGSLALMAVGLFGLMAAGWLRRAA